MPFSPIPEAIEDIRLGKMVVVVDDVDEGAVVVPAPVVVEEVGGTVVVAAVEVVGGTVEAICGLVVDDRTGPRSSSAMPCASSSASRSERGLTVSPTNTVSRRSRVEMKSLVPIFSPS